MSEASGFGMWSWYGGIVGSLSRPPLPAVSVASTTTTAPSSVIRPAGPSPSTRSLVNHWNGKNNHPDPNLHIFTYTSWFVHLTINLNCLTSFWHHFLPMLPLWSVGHIFTLSLAVISTTYACWLSWNFSAKLRSYLSSYTCLLPEWVILKRTCLKLHFRVGHWYHISSQTQTHSTLNWNLIVFKPFGLWNKEMDTHYYPFQVHIPLVAKVQN